MDKRTRAKLSESDLEVYDFIIDFALKNQYLPTVNEISKAIYLDSGGVRRRFDNLEKYGLVTYHAQSGTHRRYVVKDLRIVKRGGCK